jgi:hypothetical protein
LLRLFGANPMDKKTKILKILSYVLGLLLVISVFKNISYPLMWADESMTAMGSERVVEFGYPKAHDGKNVVNDMFCSTPKVAVNAKDDAFIGGANWGQYYFGAIGYKLADSSSDIYTKTGIFRSTFAIIGLLGLFLMALAMAKFFKEQYHKYLFMVLFLLAELISISMVLHLREVRYYSPTLFFSSMIIALYTLNRFQRPLNKILYCVLLTILLWILFNMFSPLYFIFILTIGISEAVIAAIQYLKTKNLKEAILPGLPAFGAIIVSYVAVYPLLAYFKTFEMKQVLDKFYHFNSALYWWHFSSEVSYFGKLELLWLAVIARITILINYKKIPAGFLKYFRVTNFLALLFIVFLFSVPNIDSPMFTRYLIYMQPVLVVMAISDFISLLNILPKKYVTVVFILFYGYAFTRNFNFITGHLYEMANQYKGPLDYAIPFIKSNYPHPDTLVIATDYEETSFMYYLKSKVTVGLVGNNLPEDTLYIPDIISYRRTWGNFYPSVFNGFVRKASYREIPFPCRDIPVNNIPELSFEMQAFNHYFESAITDDEQKKADLLVRVNDVK